MRRVLVVVVGGLFLFAIILGSTPVGLARQATPEACPTTWEDENIALAKRFHEEAINQRNLSVLQDILAPGVVHHAASGFPDVTSANGVTAMMSAFPEAFSDMH